MRRAGSASWRFAEGIEQLPVVALFVRDSLGLPVPAGAGIPPRLDGELPDHAALLDSDRRAAAGAAWTGWWQEALARDVRRHLHEPATAPTARNLAAWAQQFAAEHRKLNAAYPVVFDPPEFTGLADRPALREAVQLTYQEGLRWADVRRQALLMPPDGHHGQFDYRQIRAAAMQTARQHRVGQGAVHACAVVVPVQGIWWHLVAPGAAVCSRHAANDPTVARTILTDAFESGLAS